MNSTANTTSTILPNSTSPNSDSINAVALAVVVAYSSVMAVLCCTVCIIFYWKRKRSLVDRVNSKKQPNPRGDILIDLPDKSNYQPDISKDLLDHSIEPTDISTENNRTVTARADEFHTFQATGFREGPYGIESNDELVPLLPRIGIKNNADNDKLDENEHLSTGNNITVTDKTVESYTSLTDENELFDSCYHTANIQRECIYNIPESRKSTVTHLKSPTENDDEDTDETLLKSVVKSEEQNIENNLNWNRVFWYLANLLDASKYILFFNTLYDNSSYRGPFDASAKIKQVEHDTKQRVVSDSVTLLMEQFKAWKEFAGRNAKYTVICQTLQDLEWNDTSEKLETFMRKPPLLPRNDFTDPDVAGNQSSLSENSLSLSLPSNTIMSFSEPTNVAVQSHPNLYPRSGRYTYKRSYQESFEVDNEAHRDKRVKRDRDDPHGISNEISNNNYQENSDISVNQEKGPFINASQWCETKENTANTVGCVSLPNKAKLYSSNTKRKGKVSKRKIGKSHKANTSWLSRKLLSKKSYSKLIKTYLRLSKKGLKRDMYQIFLQDTISKIVKETKKSEKVISSLTCDEYHDATELQTKKETICSIYRGTKLLILRKSAYKMLKIYTDKARQQVVERLGEDMDNENRKYLFVDFDGKCFHSQEAAGDVEHETDSDDPSYITITSTPPSSDDD